MQHNRKPKNSGFNVNKINNVNNDNKNKANNPTPSPIIMDNRNYCWSKRGLGSLRWNGQDSLLGLKINLDKLTSFLLKVKVWVSLTGVTKSINLLFL